jgi:hypothetical protein
MTDRLLVFLCPLTALHYPTRPTPLAYDKTGACGRAFKGEIVRLINPRIRTRS